MADAKRYVLWGSGGHAKVLDETIRLLGGSVEALFDNAPDARSVLPGKPLIGGINEFQDWAAQTPNREGMYGLVAIGGSHGPDRLELQQLLAQHGLRVEPLVHPGASVSESSRLGPGTQVLSMALVAVGVQLGAACIMNHKSSADHECTIADGVHVGPGATLCGCVTVERHAMIGAGAVVLPRLKIGQNSIVGAGAVVTRDVPDDVVVAGNPASLMRHLPHNPHA